MRHRKRGRHLSRTKSHRAALRRNLANSLFVSGRIVTTIAKAKEVRSFVEKIITLSKKGIAVRDSNKAAYVHNFRNVFSKLQDIDAVKKLFGEGKWRESGGIANQYIDRNGGYTRILRLSGSRLGVVSGSAVGKISELKYKIFDVERKIRMIGNRLGDNSQMVIFELVEGTSDLVSSDTKEIQPAVNKESEKEEKTG